MNSKSTLSLLPVITLIAPVCLARGDVQDKPAQSPLDARISEIRMGDITIKTKPGADVNVQQVRHEFLFGTAITNHLATKDTSPMSAKDREMFIKIMRENFNYAVHENSLKWYDTEKKEGVVDYNVADEIWQICHDNSIPMRGHCIFWEKDEFVQPWIKKLNNDQLRAAVARRAVGVTQHFKGRISEFDLNNEMINGEFYVRRLGYGILSEMAWMAKAGNPDAFLCVNDYGILVEGGYNAESYIDQIENLLANGIPISGIGCQGHFVNSPGNDSSSRGSTNPEYVQKTLDRLAKFNLPIKITEALFSADTDEERAKDLRWFFTVCFAHPKVEAILMWGFWETGHWMPNMAMWKADWTPTEQARAYRDLVFNKWWTQTQGKADKAGSFKTRAFYGDYVITSAGKTKKITLSKKDKAVEVTFD